MAEIRWLITKPTFYFSQTQTGLSALGSFQLDGAMWQTGQKNVSNPLHVFPFAKVQGPGDWWQWGDDKKTTWMRGMYPSSISILVNWHSHYEKQYRGP